MFPVEDCISNLITEPYYSNDVDVLSMKNASQIY